MKYPVYFEVSDDLKDSSKKISKIHLETLFEDEAKGFVKKHFENTGYILKIVSVSRNGNFIKFGDDKLFQFTGLKDLPPAPKSVLPSHE